MRADPGAGIGLRFKRGLAVGYSPERINPGDAEHRPSTITKVTSGSSEAAGTKWNFLPFRPGLVGGHGIGVDPCHLTHKAEQLGYDPQVVLAGRRINDGMGRWVVEQLVLEMARRGMVIGGASVQVLGLAFKENCPDLRNTRVVDSIDALRRLAGSRRWWRTSSSARWCRRSGSSCGCEPLDVLRALELQHIERPR